MEEKKHVSKSQLFKEIIEISGISDPKIITRLTSNINDIERTLAMCNGAQDEEVRTVIVTYLRVTKGLEEKE